MKLKITKSIIQKTIDFYKNISEEFNVTRTYSWTGWKEIFSDIPFSDNFNVLDVACGNARFFNFLQKTYLQDFKFLGVDFDDNLLSVAIKRYNENSNFKIKKLDVINDLTTISKTFDLVVAFGITHHIPTSKLRKIWFKNLSNLVCEKGYLVISFWNFLNKKSCERANNLEENDFWVGWGSTNQKRYCHYYNKNEVNEIIKIYKENKLELIKQITKENDLNSYYVFKKI